MMSMTSFPIIYRDEGAIPMPSEATTLKGRIRELEAERAEVHAHLTGKGETAYCMTHLDGPKTELGKAAEKANAERDKLRAELDAILAGNDAAMFKLWIKRAQEKHGQQPDCGETWIQTTCAHCNVAVLFSCGDTRDLTVPDDDGVKCWSCGKVTDLRSEIEREMTDAAEPSLVTDSIPDPRTLRAERDDALRHASALAGMLATSQDNCDKLQRFKDWVHNFLDAHGVPHHPPGTHGAAGCRIGDRMDWLMAQLVESRNISAENVVRLVAAERERDENDATATLNYDLAHKMRVRAQSAESERDRLAAELGASQADNDRLRAEAGTGPDPHGRHPLTAELAALRAAMTFGRKPIVEPGWYLVWYAEDDEFLMEHTIKTDKGGLVLDIGENGFFPPSKPAPGTLWAGPIEPPPAPEPDQTDLGALTDDRPPGPDAEGQPR